MSLFRKAVLLLIILVASVLRFSYFEFVEFNDDQALNLFLAQEILEHAIPKHCMLSSVGLCNSPVFPYFLSLFMLISSNALFMTGVIALTSVATVIGLFLFVKRFFSIEAAFISASLMSVNPWLIFYSRSVWQQNILPGFTILILWLIFELLLEKKHYDPTRQEESKESVRHKATGIRHKFKKYCDPFARDLTCMRLITISALLGFFVQLHQPALIFVPLFTGLLIWQRKKVHLKMAIWSTLVFISTFIPYAVYIIKSNFYSFNNLLNPKYGSDAHDLSTLLLPVKIATTMGLEDFILNDVLSLPIVDLFTAGILFGVLMMSALLCFNNRLALSACSKGIFKNDKLSLVERNRLLAILLIWMLAPTLFLLLSPGNIYMHHILMTVPVQFILFGIFCDAIIKAFSQRWRKISASALICFIIVYQLAVSLDFLSSTSKVTSQNKFLHSTYKFKYYYVKSCMESGMSDTEITDSASKGKFAYQYIYEGVSGGSKEEW